MAKLMSGFLFPVSYYMHSLLFYVHYMRSLFEEAVSFGVCAQITFNTHRQQENISKMTFL